MEHKHLFILCPPASGSTVLWKLLQTSPAVSTFPVEGQTLVKDILFTPRRWDPELPIPWERVRAAWRSAWDLDKPVLLEKSPPHLVRAAQLQEYFTASHFVIMVRNPYAFCEGVRRRWRQDLDYAAIARNWADWAGRQVENRLRLQRALFFSYEDLCADPREACQRLLIFLPELGELHPELEFAVFEKSQAIGNLNERQIARLSVGDIREINGVLAGYAELLQTLGYELMAERPMSAAGGNTTRSLS